MMLERNPAPPPRGYTTLSKRIATSNVIPFRTKAFSKSAAARNGADAALKGTADAGEEALSRADDLVTQASYESGKKRTTLLNKALKISPDCVGAYIGLSDDTIDAVERIELLRKAVKAGERVLGSDWEQKYRGRGWGVWDTRPVMRAMMQLAMELLGEDEFEEALQIYRRLMKVNPSDNQGVRYKLAGCLYEAGRDDELTKLLAQYDDDICAELKYVQALQLFRKEGPSERAQHALKVAFNHNPYVPAYLTDLMEMPDGPLTSVGIGDESEAADYAMGCCDMWDDTEGATTWMAETLAPLMYKRFPEERDLMDAVIKELKMEGTD
jgi:tetratricopeptide (TPR) repeat protein